MIPCIAKLPATSQCVCYHPKIIFLGFVSISGWSTPKMCVEYTTYESTNITSYNIWVAIDCSLDNLKISFEKKPPACHRKTYMSFVCYQE